MTDEHGDLEHHTPTAPSGLISLGVRTVLRIIEKTGHEEAARRIREAPEIVGDKIGGLINALLRKKEKGEAITPEDQKKIESVLKENPREATQLVGVAVASAMESVNEDEHETGILNSYKGIFDVICDMMAELKTSLALRGFLQGGDCISYWHIKGDQPKFMATKNSLYPSDLEVYLLWNQETTPESLAGLNETIRRSDRQLPRTSYDHRHDEAIGMVKYIYELSIEVERMPDSATPENKSDSIFGLSKLPRSIQYEIPTGAPNLLTMFESFLEAVEVQGRHRREVNKITRAILERATERPNPTS